MASPLLRSDPKGQTSPQVRMNRCRNVSWRNRNRRKIWQYKLFKKKKEGIQFLCLLPGGRWGKKRNV